MAEPQRVGPGFAPVAGPESRVLILGSFPSVKSREVGFYYGHPQNRFWPLLAALLQKPVPQTTAQKQQLILQNGLALWDTVCCCTKIFCNGAASWRVYQKYAWPQTRIPAVKLPSTSPANAAWGMEKLQKVWGEALKDCCETKL